MCYIRNIYMHHYSRRKRRVRRRTPYGNRYGETMGYGQTMNHMGGNKRRRTRRRNY